MIVLSYSWEIKAVYLVSSTLVVCVCVCACVQRAYVHACMRACVVLRENHKDIIVRKFGDDLCQSH